MFRNRSAQNTENKKGGFLRKQLLDIIEWEDDSQDTLVYKFPMQDKW
jgi:membrane protease subunit (stomatin/prohibitin family)